MSNSGRLVFYIALASALFITLGVSIFVPMHSDDYFYFNLGLSFTEHLNHYMNWSGRIFADYISSFLLNMFNTDVVNVLNAMAVISLLFVVTQIPYAGIKKGSLFVLDRFSAFSFLLIFILYWVANPQLGHTTFWIVGAANYLWVSLIAVIYFYTLVKAVFDDRRYSAVAVMALSLLALLAGVSNESLSVSVVLISLVIVFIAPSNTPMYCFYAGSSIVGFLILVLSPGQTKRANIDAFSNWYSLSFIERVYEHFFNRVPSILGQFWILWIAFIIVSLAACLKIKGNKSERTHDRIKIGIIFFISALVSLAALVGAPYIPPRSTNAVLILTLCSLSFFLAISRGEGHEKNVFLGVLFLVVFSYFSMSYYLMFSAIKNINRQDAIRKNILDSKSSDVVIPGFYMTRLMKESDSIDYLHHSAASMQKYYKKNKIASVEVHFDYSQLNENSNAMNTTHIKKADSTIIGIWPYKDGLSNNKVLIGFDCSFMKKSKDTGMSLFTHIYYNTEMSRGINAGFLNVDPQGEVSEFNGHCYKVYPHGKDFNISSIGRIEYGLYSPVSGERSSSSVIEFLQ